jgi:hypothetical protein
VAQTFRGKISLDKAMRQKWCGRSQRFFQIFRSCGRPSAVVAVNWMGFEASWVGFGREKWDGGRFFDKNVGRVGR